MGSVRTVEQVAVRASVTGEAARLVRAEVRPSYTAPPRRRGMNVSFEFDGPLATAAGGRLTRDALAAAADNDGLRDLLFRSDGTVRPHPFVSVDGEAVERPGEEPVGERVTVVPGLGC